MVHAAPESSIDWTILRDFLDLGWPDDPEKLPPASLLRELLRTPRHEGLKPISPVSVQEDDPETEKMEKDEEKDVTEIQVRILFACLIFSLSENISLFKGGDSSRGFN